ncbi:cardiolipin synthase [Clostridiaceae bacterium 14S0207]|nr:cardiolipin synthase [Clostridiaceae bacterium 14S0207]
MGLGIFLGISLVIVNLMLAGALIFFERKDPTTTWAWLFVIIFLPIIGFLIYLVFGQNMTREKLFKYKIVIDERKKESFDKIREKYKDDISTLENIDIIHMNYKNCRAAYTQLNEVKLFYDGKEKFKGLFKALMNAKEFIHMEYYIIQNDEMGKTLINILTKKVKEGVEVKLLFDGMGSYKINNKKFLKEFVTSGGKYAVFFPSIIARINRRINYRNHRKIVVIDGTTGFLGGFNVGNEYVNKDKKIGYWRDTHLLIKGEAVKDLEERFLLDWTYAAHEDIKNVNKYFCIDDSIKNIVGMQIVSSGPDHKEEYIKNAYVKIINNAKKYIYLQTPYFVPDETVLQSLRIAALSGVEVKIMIPGNPDHKFMKWAANSYIGDLLDAGAKIYLYEKGFIHAKTIVSDDLVCSVGTANMDIRSFRLNFETNGFIYNSHISQEMKKMFEVDIRESRFVTKEDYINRSKWSKIAESIVRLLSPIL